MYIVCERLLRWKDNWEEKRASNRVMRSSTEGVSVYQTPQCLLRHLLPNSSRSSNCYGNHRQVYPISTSGQQPVKSLAYYWDGGRDFSTTNHDMPEGPIEKCWHGCNPRSTRELPTFGQPLRGCGQQDNFEARSPPATLSTQQDQVLVAHSSNWFDHTVLDSVSLLLSRPNSHSLGSLSKEITYTQVLSQGPTSKVESIEYVKQGECIQGNGNMCGRKTWEARSQKSLTHLGRRKKGQGWCQQSREDIRTSGPVRQELEQDMALLLEVLPSTCHWQNTARSQLTWSLGNAAYR